MEKFKEKKPVVVLLTTSLVIFLLSVLSLFLMFLADCYIMVFISGLLICVVLAGIASMLSKQGEYTDEFIRKIQNDLKLAKTLDDLTSIRTEFEKCAISGNQYCLKYPSLLREIHNEIIFKIQILEKQ